MPCDIPTIGTLSKADVGHQGTVGRIAIIHRGDRAIAAVAGFMSETSVIQRVSNLKRDEWFVINDEDSQSIVQVDTPNSPA